MQTKRTKKAGIVGKYGELLQVCNSNVFSDSCNVITVLCFCL